MAYEDFTTFTEVDEDTDITVATNTLTVDSLRRDANSYVYKDYGADHFDDFEHLIDVKTTAHTETYGFCGVWSITNGNFTTQDMVSAGEGLQCFLYRTATAEKINIEDWNLVNTDFYTDFVEGTYDYLTIERSGTTLTCKIYSDSARTTLLDTLSITSGTTAKRYCAALQSRETTGADSDTLSLLIDNLDLQEGGTVHTHTPSDSFSISDGLGVVYGAIHTKADTFSINDSIAPVYGAIHSATDLLQISDNVTHSCSYAVTLNDTLIITDTFQDTTVGGPVHFWFPLYFSGKFVRGKNPLREIR